MDTHDSPADDWIDRYNAPVASHFVLSLSLSLSLSLPLSLALTIMHDSSGTLVCLPGKVTPSPNAVSQHNKPAPRGLAHHTKRHNTPASARTMPERIQSQNPPTPPQRKCTQSICFFVVADHAIFSCCAVLLLLRRHFHPPTQNEASSCYSVILRDTAPPTPSDGSWAARAC